MTREQPRSLLSNTLASGASTVWVALLTLALVPLLLRQLGPDEYGIWVLLGVATVQGRGIASLFDLGQQQSLIQRVASADQDVAARRLGAGLRLLTLVGIVTGGVVLFAAPWLVEPFDLGSLSSQATMALRLIGIQVALELPLVGIAAGLEGLRRYEFRGGLDAARTTVFTGGAIVVAFQGGGVVALAAVSLVTTVAYGVGLCVGVSAYGLRPRSGGPVREELRAGLPLLALRATGVGYRQLDKIVLGIVVGSVAVAGFDVADKVNMAALTVLGISCSALIPAAAHGLRAAPERTRALALRATEWSALLTLPLVGFVFGAARPLTEAIAGQNISGAPAAIRWLALSTGVSVVYAATFSMAIGAAAASRLVRVSLAGLVLNLVATVALSRAYGLPGSAAATFFAAAIITPIVARICADVFGHPTVTLFRVVAPAMALGVLVGIVSWLPTLAWGTAESLIVASVAGALFTLAWLAVTWHRARLQGIAPTFHTPTVEELT